MAEPEPRMAKGRGKAWEGSGRGTNLDLLTRQYLQDCRSADGRNNRRENTKKQNKKTERQEKRKKNPIVKTKKKSQGDYKKNIGDKLNIILKRRLPYSFEEK